MTASPLARAEGPAVAQRWHAAAALAYLDASRQLFSPVYACSESNTRYLLGARRRQTQRSLIRQPSQLSQQRAPQMIDAGKEARREQERVGGCADAWQGRLSSRSGIGVKVPRLFERGLDLAQPVSYTHLTLPTICSV